MPAGGLVIDAGAEGVGQTTSAATNRTYLNQMITAVALRGKGKIILPKTDPDGFIGVDQYLYLKDNVVIEGSGWQSTHIKNTSPTEGAFTGAGRLFDVGNRNQADMNSEPTYGISAIAVGDRTVTLTTAGDRLNFAPGMIVWAWTTEMASNTSNLHRRCEFNEIVSIASNGVITMDKPFKVSIAGANPRLVTSSGALNDPSGRPRRMVKNVRLANLKASTTYPPAWITAAGGSYNCVFEDMLWDSRAGLYYNDHAYCTFRRMIVYFHDRMMECADYSHDNMHEDITGYFKDRGLGHDGESIISFNGQVRRNIARGFRLYATDSPELAGLHFGQAVDCKFEDAEMYVQAVTGQGIRFNAAADESKNNTANNIDIYIGSAAANPVIFNAGVDADQDNNAVRDIRFHGTQASDYAIQLTRAKNPVIQNVRSQKGGYSAVPGVSGLNIDNLIGYGIRHQTVVRTRTRAITAMSNASGLVQFYADTHGFVTGDVASILAPPGTTLGGKWVVTRVDDNNFILQGSNYGTAGTFSMGGSAQWEVTGTVRGLRDLSAVDLESATDDGNAVSVPVTSSTASGNVLKSWLVRADTLISRDTFRARAMGTISGTVGAKTVAFNINGVEYGAMVYAAGESGAWEIEIEIACEVPVSTKSVIVRGIKNGLDLSPNFARPVIDSQAGPLRIDLVGFVANASDSISTYYVNGIGRRIFTTID